MATREAGLVTFSDVSFEYNHNKPTLIGASFVIRRGSKVTLMGQNGAGKSTIFGLITSELEPTAGVLNILPRTTIAVSRQVIPRDELVTVTAVIRSVDDAQRQITAEGFLSVDGRVIYQMKSFTLAVT